MENNLPIILDQTIQMIGPYTPAGKALINAQKAYQNGNQKLAQQLLFKAFDNLPEDSVDANKSNQLTTAEKTVIEKTLADLLQTPQTNSSHKQQIIDNLLNQSYQNLRQTGSRASWRYLLEALDKAGIPLDQTSPQLQKALIKLTQKVMPNVAQVAQIAPGGQIAQIAQTGGDPSSIGGIALGAGIGLGSLVLFLILYFIYKSRSPRPMPTGAVQPSESIYSEAPATIRDLQLVSSQSTSDPIYSKLPGNLGIPNISLDDDAKKLMAQAVRNL